MKFQSSVRWNSVFVLATALLIGANAWSACDAEHQKSYSTAQEVSRKWATNFILSTIPASKSEESAQIHRRGKPYLDRLDDAAHRFIELEKCSIENCFRPINQPNTNERGKLRNAFLMTGTQYTISTQACQPNMPQPNALLVPSQRANLQDQFVPPGTLTTLNRSGSGISHWGFGRLSDCQFNVQHAIPLYSKIKAEWFEGQSDNQLRNLRNEFVSGRLTGMIMNGRGDPAAVRRLQEDITSLTQQCRTAVDEAKGYGHLMTEGELGTSVAKRMQNCTLLMSCTAVPNSKDTYAARNIVYGVGAKNFTQIQ